MGACALILQSEGGYDDFPFLLFFALLLLREEVGGEDKAQERIRRELDAPTQE